ncbi:MAG: hypothetical protein J4452_00190 [Candidatus Aenigmarchaeota archaeon]|nr:hypothetical protein [Candidatus Aenigmarchaeota archaeon]
MPVISVFRFEMIPETHKICRILNSNKFEGKWFTAKPSKYNESEVFIQFWFYEDVEESFKRIYSEDDFYEIVTYLKENGKNKVLKRIYIFMNTFLKTLEVYRGNDEKTTELVSILESLLDCKFEQLSLPPETLAKIFSEHSNELKQVMFRNVNGFFYDIIRGNYLEANDKFIEYMQTFPDKLRVISFRPKIKFLNNFNKYQVTVNGDKGTIRLSSNEVFQWRPRFEIRQLVFILISSLGLLGKRQTPL